MSNEKDINDDANFNEIVEEIVDCLSEANLAKYNSIVEENKDILDE